MERCPAAIYSRRSFIQPPTHPQHGFPDERLHHHSDTGISAQQPGFHQEIQGHASSCLHNDVQLQEKKQVNIYD